MHIKLIFHGGVGPLRERKKSTSRYVPGIFAPKIRRNMYEQLGARRCFIESNVWRSMAC